MKHMILRSFTLLEMMIVITVIAIMMAVTLRFGGNRINELDTFTLKQNTVDTIESTYRTHLMSNYYQGGVYDKLMLTFASGTSVLNEYYFADTLLGIETQSFSPKVSLDSLLVDGKEQEKVSVSFVPYTIDCAINGMTGLSFTFALHVDQEIYCYAFSSACKLVEQPCK